MAVNVKLRSQWDRLFRRRGILTGSNSAFAANFGFNPDNKAARLLGIDKSDCPFFETGWGKREVLAWIDRQIDAAKSHSWPARGTRVFFSNQRRGGNRG